MDLKVQSYRGQPVLTWWEGQVITGYGEGQAVIADSSYRTIATVNAGHGLQADLHEFVITPQDTALITAFRPVAADLSALGGPRQGTVLSGAVQEIDIASGQVLFEWDSLDHVPVTDTFVPFAGGTKAAPFDYFHINSIAIAPDGDLLISARNTSTIQAGLKKAGFAAAQRLRDVDHGEFGGTLLRRDGGRCRRAPARPVGHRADTAMTRADTAATRAGDAMTRAGDAMTRAGTP